MEWIFVAVILFVVLYCVSRLPKLGRNLGQGIVEFKRNMREAVDYDPRADKPVKSGKRRAKSAGRRDHEQDGL